MPEQNSNLTFGPYLKAKREEAGLSLEYVSMQTRIGIEMLESIENEDHAKLPEPVYVKGFIRAYAEVIGADTDTAIHSYLESRRNFQGITPLATGFTGRKKKKTGSFLPRFIMGVLSIAALSVIAILSVSFYQDRFGSETLELSDTTQEISDENNALLPPTDISEQPEEANEETPTSLPEEIGEEKEPAFPDKKTELFNLSISATADTWIRVIIDGDGENKKDYLLKPGDTISLKAGSHYNLLIGNAGGVQLSLNGQPVHVPGRMGQVVTMTLP